MAQSVRERVPQFAVLKTLGFSDNTVLGFVMAETTAMCALGGLVGLGLATLPGGAMAKASPMMPFAIEWAGWEVRVGRHAWLRGRAG